MPIETTEKEINLATRAISAVNNYIQARETILNLREELQKSEMVITDVAMESRPATKHALGVEVGDALEVVNAIAITNPQLKKLYKLRS